MYLFIILVEALGRNLSKAVLEGRIEGFRPASSLDPLSHLQFANDSLIITKASVPQAKTLKHILMNFEKEAGQKINF